MKMFLRIVVSVLPFFLFVSRALCQDLSSSETESSQVIESDVNKDGKTDGWSYVRDGYVDRQEIDMNFDGKVDSIFMYERDGRIKEELLDTNYDGKIDNWRYYSKGEVVKDSMDSDYDGSADVWFYIDKGRVYKMEEDTTGDGKPDRTTTY